MRVLPRRSEGDSSRFALAAFWNAQFTAGTQLFQTTGPSRRGVHTVNWAFQNAASAKRELSPSERRDSTLMKTRAPVVIHSLQKANYHSTALAAVRRLLQTPKNPPARPL